VCGGWTLPGAAVVAVTRAAETKKLLPTSITGAKPAHQHTEHQRIVSLLAQGWTLSPIFVCFVVIGDAVAARVASSSQLSSRQPQAALVSEVATDVFAPAPHSFIEQRAAHLEAHITSRYPIPFD
jgi:hypothetical protein